MGGTGVVDERFLLRIRFPLFPNPAAYRRVLV